MAPPLRASLPGLDFLDPVLEASIRRGLGAVEELLRTSVHSNYPFVTETSRHLVEAGGKRFRPLVVLLAAASVIRTRAAVVPAAVAIELTHLSTLYHDDVMDEAVLRRGACRPTRGGRIRSPSSPATSSSPGPRRSPPTSAPRPPGSWRRRSPCCARGRSARRSVRAPAIRSRTTARWSRRRPARSSRPPAGWARCCPGASPAAVVGPHRLRRPHRRRLPDLRRPARHHQPVGRVRQDSGHRPSRGRPHPAGAPRRAGRPGRARRPLR